MLKPLSDFIVLEKIKTEQKTKSGIILKADDTDEQSIGKVVKVGPGKYIDGTLQTPQVKEGDQVVYKEYSATKVKLDNSEYLIVKESDIYAIVEE
jgi:chaperonin GroES